LVHYDFSGKTALVTGGGSGIGRAVALALQAAGCRVLVLSLPDGIMFPSNDQPGSGTISFFACDVTSEVDLSRVFERIDELDMVIHCAGIIARADEFHPQVFTRVIEVNLTSAMQVNSCALPLLAKRGGCIVHTASMLSFFGSGFAPAYSASKGGIVQLTKSLAIAWASHGIRVNAVAPGWIATAFTQALQDSPERSHQILERTPLKRWGTADDIAGPILFLCSSAAEFITGATLVVDGGYSAC
jgi:NAD(P)-dependent dehydrogenase (short-subunit alcohol dehydrogenase family)